MMSRIVISAIFEFGKGDPGAEDVYQRTKERKVPVDRDERTRPTAPTTHKHQSRGFQTKL
jgi:hypothetical protein